MLYPLMVSIQRHEDLYLDLQNAHEDLPQFAMTVLRLDLLYLSGNMQFKISSTHSVMMHSCVLLTLTLT